MKVVLDTALCQGHGMCVLEAPDVFALAKHATTVTIHAEAIDEAGLEDVKQAVKYCPNAALSLED
jgi:ferredoxin